MTSKTPFPEHAATKDYRAAVTELIDTLNIQNTYQFLNPRNVQRFSHGITWRTHSGDESAKEPSSLKSHSTELIIKWEDIVKHDLSVLTKSIKTLLDAMGSQMTNEMYSVINTSTEKSGNVVSAAEIGFEKAFIEMLKKIELSVNEEGEVELPQIHIGQGSPLPEKLKAAGPEFNSEVDKIFQEKKLKAIAKERERVSKFKS